MTNFKQSGISGLFVRCKVGTIQRTKDFLTVDPILSNVNL